MTLNSTQLELFKNLIIELDKNEIDIFNINELTSLPLFKTWRNILKTICGNKMVKEENIPLNNICELHLEDLIIKYFEKEKTRFNKTEFNLIFENFLTYLKNEQNMLYYFSPIYNFEFDDDNLIIDENIKIRKISEHEKKYLLNYYEHFVPIKVSINKIKYVFVINIKNDVEDASSTVSKKVFQVLNKFKILKNGDILSGGLYNFDKSENWNPKNRFQRINIEPVGVFSKNIYNLRKKHSKKFQTMLKKITNRYPMLEINYTVSNKTEETKINEYLLKYDDYFDRVIRRFSAALEKKNESEKIVDLILALEILLVSSPGDSTLKISQRTALFIGKNDKEKLEIWRYMQTFYSFRSGQVHEFTDRAMKVKNIPEITKKEAIKKLEIWARRSILQMIFFSQKHANSKLTAKQLYSKIDEAMFDANLRTEFIKLDKVLKPFQ